MPVILPVVGNVAGLEVVARVAVICLFADSLICFSVSGPLVVVLEDANFVWEGKAECIFCPIVLVL